MKIIKRNGSEAVFDITKIIAALNKANAAVPENARMDQEQILGIAATIEEDCVRMNRAPSVEEIQELVETAIMNEGAFEVAKQYIRYRYTRSLVRRSNTTDNRILSLIECNNEEVKQENANKNPTVNSVQRDYMAGEVSKDITCRLLLPEDVVRAHNEGIIHFHDMDYYAQHMHNCDLVNLEDMLQNGTVHLRHHDRKAPQLLHRLQHRHPDHRSGGLESVRRAEHFAGSSGALRSGLPGEDSPGRDGGGRGAGRHPGRGGYLPTSSSAVCATRSTRACRPFSIRWSR